MEKLRFMLSFLALILTASLASSCGASSHGQNPLQSITLSPATADAQDYPNGEVQFTATGHYVDPPHTVTPQSATWEACQQNGPITTEVSLTQGGVAQCAIGAAGTYSINAWNSDKIEPCAINACGILVCAIVGTAQLTCP